VAFHLTVNNFSPDKTLLVQTIDFLLASQVTPPALEVVILLALS
jgi:hypothetical protein